MRWIDYVVQAMENLGGEAAYSDLYAEIEELKGGNLTKSWKATVRNTVESYSSDSDNWVPSRDDLFYSVDGKGSGRWALRNFEANQVSEPPVDYDGADKQDYTVSRFIRDSKLSRQVKTKNNFKCQICGFTFLLSNGKPYAEAHHLKPLGKEHNGPDIEGNLEVFVDSDYMLQVGDEIGLVKDNPRLLVIVSHSFVEMIVKTLSDYYLPEVKLKNHNQRLEKLRKEQVIDEFQFQVYDWFRDLRNKAAHTPIFRLSDSHFEALVGVVKREQLGVRSFHLFSIKLISELWNKHLDILGPAYLGKYC